MFKRRGGGGSKTFWTMLKNCKICKVGHSFGMASIVPRPYLFVQNKNSTTIISISEKKLFRSFQIIFEIILTWSKFNGCSKKCVWCNNNIQMNVSWDKCSKRRSSYSRSGHTWKGLAPFTYTVKLWKICVHWPSLVSGSNQTWHIT